jgi:hypothetical protein
MHYEMPAFVRNIEGPTRRALNGLIQENDGCSTVARKRIDLRGLDHVGHDNDAGVLQRPTRLQNGAIHPEVPMQAAALGRGFDFLNARSRHLRHIEWRELEERPQSVYDHAD